MSAPPSWQRSEDRGPRLHHIPSLTFSILFLVLSFPAVRSTDAASAKADAALHHGSVSEPSRVAFARRDLTSFDVLPKRIAPLKKQGGRGHVASTQQVSKYSVIGKQNYDIQLRNNGGNIMTARVRVYLIFYGTWAQGGKKQRLVETFVRSLGNASVDSKGSTVHKWWNINSLYTQPDGKRGSVGIVHKASVFVKTSASLPSSGSVANVVRTLINNGRLPADANGIYSVLTSPGITVGTQEDGYCITYCGWHSSFFSGGYRMKFLFASDASLCSGCSGSSTSSTPQGVYGVDTMVDTLAHELTEALTDPDVATGWFDPRNGNENADACNTFYPAVKWAGNAPYNLLGVDGHKWLIQSNVHPKTQLCILNLAKPATG